MPCKKNILFRKKYRKNMYVICLVKKTYFLEKTPQNICMLYAL